MAKSDFEFFFPLRVRYAETDAQGFVFNAHYLTYLDTAGYEFFRWLGFDFKEHVKTTGQDFHTVRVSLDFMASAGFDEEIEIHVRPARIGNSSLTMAMEIYRKDGDELLVGGQVVWVNTDQASHRSAPLPQGLRDRLNGLRSS